MPPRPDATLHAILKGVSRSFYLSMQILPEAVQGPIALGYLLARAADTLADTEAVPGARRRELLALLQRGVLGQATPDAVQAEVDRESRSGSAVVDRESRSGSAVVAAVPGGATAAEQHLLQRVGDCLRLLLAQPAGDRELLQRVLQQLIHGMDTDLGRFPTSPVGPEQVVALADQAALDDYTYYAAGCVGEFWTAVTAAHVPALQPLLAPELLARGVALGRCLQLVNVVRDAAADLRAGRCYWPRAALALEGLTPVELATLAQPEAAPPTAAQHAALLRVTGRLVKQAQDLAAQSWGYVQAIPAREVRLRLACTWPLLLGLRTLEQIASTASVPRLSIASTASVPWSSTGRRGAPLLGDPPIKVARGAVYRLVARSSAAALWDAAWGREQGGALDWVEASLALDARAAGR